MMKVHGAGNSELHGRRSSAREGITFKPVLKVESGQCWDAGQDQRSEALAR
jgi:hypothetical protein